MESITRCIVIVCAYICTFNGLIKVLYFSGQQRTKCVTNLGYLLLSIGRWSTIETLYLVSNDTLCYNAVYHLIYTNRDVSSTDITEDLIAVLPALCTVYCSSGPVNWYNLLFLMLKFCMRAHVDKCLQCM